MCGAKAITTIALLGSFVQGNAAVAAAEMESHGQTHPQRECDSPVGTWLYTVTIPDPSGGNPTPTSSPGTVSEVDAHVVLAIAYLFLGRAYEQKANLPEAVETFRKGLQLEDNTELWAALGHALAVSGKREEALEVLGHRDDLAKHRYVAPYNFALVHLGLGQKEQAFEWLERACQARSYLLAIYLNTDARLRPLYSDTRYAELLHRIRLPPPRYNAALHLN